jgi:ClpP class serine protease
MIPEVGEQIKAGRNIKPIYAIANVMAGSAAYWLASQATKLYVTPSGSVGSIGVYTVHEDQSVKDANEGRKFTYVSAGRNKTEGNTHEPLSEEAKAHKQEAVDDFYDDFVNVVAEGRGVSASKVEKDFGQGRMFMSKKALEAGMVDDIMSYDELVSQVVLQPQKVKIAIDGKKIAAIVAGINSGKLKADQITTGTLIDGVVHLESKEWEHSEPGTGSPPEPKKEEDGSDDIAIVQGWRRPTPPPQDQPSGTSASSSFSNTPKSAKGGVRMANDDEFVLSGKDARELLHALNLDADTEPAKVVEAIKIQFGELNALRQSVDAAEQERIFAETYPQYWEEHRKLMERDREHTASNFVESVTKVRKTEGYGLKDTKQALSVEAKNTVAEAHKKFSEGRGSLEDFETSIKAIVNGGIVQFGEIGNSQDDDSIPEWDTNSATGVAGARKLFAECVTKVRSDNPSMSYQEALVEASKKYPDLAEAYKITLPA